MKIHEPVKRKKLKKKKRKEDSMLENSKRIRLPRNSMSNLRQLYFQKYPNEEHNAFDYEVGKGMVVNENLGTGMEVCKKDTFSQSMINDELIKVEIYDEDLSDNNKRK